MIFVYCYDAYCTWCFGFRSVMQQLAATYPDIPVEVLSGGMILPEKPVHISASASYIAQAYPEVEAATGATFGKDYRWHIHNPEQSDWFPNSEKPAIALSIIKEQHPEKSLFFASDLQKALFMEGRDLTDDEAYRHLLPLYHVEPEQFYSDLHSEHFKTAAHQDFALVQQLQVKGFPALFLQASEFKFYLLSNGYTDWEPLHQRTDQILANLITNRY